jgi:hypothetical protein
MRLNPDDLHRWCSELGLSTRTEEMMRLRYVEGQGVQEIAATYSCTVNRVCVTTSRGWKKIHSAHGAYLAAEEIAAEEMEAQAHGVEPEQDEDEQLSRARQITDVIWAELHPRPHAPRTPQFDTKYGQARPARVNGKPLTYDDVFSIVRHGILTAAPDLPRNVSLGELHRWLEERARVIRFSHSDIE